ncbi:hypothetical protein MRB53_037565 [Persea americana]|nr:hypothetical protein MRB53_037565 [Persea americana]
MAAFLSPWLEHLLNRELHVINDLKGRGDALHIKREDEDGLRTYFDDGSNIRVTPQINHLPSLQILEVACRPISCANIDRTQFLPDKFPFKAQVSDTRSSIRVTFDIASVRDFERKYHHSIKRNTIGGILVLTDFELVITSIGPQNDRASLFAKKFDWKGNQCETLGRPRPLNDEPSISNS